MTRLYLVRHGATDWTREARCQGSTDLPLSEEGRWQAAKLAEFLAQEDLESLYTSDLRRCVETAAFVEAASGLVAQPDPRLREINFGLWEGRLWSDIAKEDPEVLDKLWLGRFYPPGGEPLSHVVERVSEALHEILDRERERRVAVVFHGGPIRIALKELLQLEDQEVRTLEIAPGSVSLVEVGSPARAHYINFVPWEKDDA